MAGNKELGTATYTVVTTHPVKANQLVKVGDIIGIALANARPGEIFTVQAEGKWEVPLESGKTVALGVALYAKEKESNVYMATTDKTSHFLGYALDKGTALSEVLVALHPMPVINGTN